MNLEGRWGPSLVCPPSLKRTPALLSLSQNMFDVSLSPYLTAALLGVVIYKNWLSSPTVEPDHSLRSSLPRSQESSDMSEQPVDRQRLAEHSTGLRQRRYKVAGERKLYPGRSLTKRDKIRAKNLLLQARLTPVGRGGGAAESKGDDDGGAACDGVSTPTLGPAASPECDEFTIKSPWKMSVSLGLDEASLERKADLEFLFHVVDKKDTGILSSRDLQAVLWCVMPCPPSLP